MHMTWPLDVPPESFFPITNIPFGIFSTAELPTKRAGIAIGEHIVDLSCLEDAGFFSDCFHQGYSNRKTLGIPEPATPIFSQSSLNNFASLPSTVRSSVRDKIIALLQDEHSILFTNSKINDAAFHLQKDATMHIPMQIGDFTDFMCSRVHVDNCSRMAGASVPSNFHAFPAAYNGRSSSVVISGTRITRPLGMLRVQDASPPTFEFAPSKCMDYELELGFFISKPIPFGQTLKSADEAKNHIFGFVLLNDWSARDIQFAEMTPLGPFNGKGSATTISPWVVTLDALEGAEAGTRDEEALERIAGRTCHLRHEGKEYTWNIGVDVGLRRREKEILKVGESNLRDLYWSPMQMLSHHASSGCGLRTGDLLGTGTISSPATRNEEGVSSLGCLHEMTSGGTKAFVLQNGEKITWIEDGDEVVMTGKAVRLDGSVIGFGECSNVLESALAD